jgi:hypothetical protein
MVGLFKVLTSLQRDKVGGNLFAAEYYQRPWRSGLFGTVVVDLVTAAAWNGLNYRINNRIVTSFVAQNQEFSKKDFNLNRNQDAQKYFSY